jgi:hypothetical protein
LFSTCPATRAARLVQDVEVPESAATPAPVDVAHQHPGLGVQGIFMFTMLVLEIHLAGLPAPSSTMT